MHKINFENTKRDNREFSKNINWPKISIITPSYNQGCFIEETIISVLDQNYPNLEYIIIDGGSTDDTISIIKKYESKIAYWKSENDDGQSDAINKGFMMATGEIVGWLNSDDYYLPNTFRSIANVYLKQKSNNDNNFWIIGNCLAKGSLDWRFESKPFTKLDILSFWNNVIGQPAVFWTSNFIGHPILEKSLNYAMDLDLWLRMRNIKPPISLNEDLAVARYYESTKTSTGDYKRFLELKEVLTKHNDCKKQLTDRELSKKLFASCFDDYASKSLIIPHNQFYQQITEDWNPSFRQRFDLVFKLSKKLVKILIK